MLRTWATCRSTCGLTGLSGLIVEATALALTTPGSIPVSQPVRPVVPHWRDRSAVGKGGTVEFEQFVAARGPALLRTARLLTGSHHEAEDLVQTVLARMLVHWNKVGDEFPEAYARRALVNASMNLRQRFHARRSSSDVVPDSGVPDVSDAQASRDAMWRSLQQLPRKQRAVLVLRYYDDYTEQEIAAALDCSVGTVKSQASKALGKLRCDPALADAFAVPSTKATP
jgi:RNA polymerase sigma-70 factor (sigma-E family)